MNNKFEKRTPLGLLNGDLRRLEALPMTTTAGTIYESSSNSCGIFVALHHDTSGSEGAYCKLHTTVRRFYLEQSFTSQAVRQKGHHLLKSLGRYTCCSLFFSTHSQGSLQYMPCAHNPFQSRWRLFMFKIVLERFEKQMNFQHHAPCPSNNEGHGEVKPQS